MDGEDGRPALKHGAIGADPRVKKEFYDKAREWNVPVPEFIIT